MDICVNFTLQNLLGTGDSQLSNLIPESFFSTLHFLSRFVLRGLNNAIGFNFSLLLSLLNDRLTTFLAISTNTMIFSISTGIIWVRKKSIG